MKSVSKKAGAVQNLGTEADAALELGAVDAITPQINRLLARWGNAMPAPLPDERQLAAEYDYAMALLATDPPDYQAGPLRVAASRIGQARRMYIWQAVYA